MLSCVVVNRNGYEMRLQFLLDVSASKPSDGEWILDRFAIRLLDFVDANSNPHRRLLRKQMQRAVKCVGQGGLALDVGSGKAPYRDFLQSYRFMAIDISSEQRPTIRASMTDLPIRTGSVNLVVCTEALEHEFHFERALDELNRVLAASGAAIITTPLLLGEHDRQDYHRFTLAALERHLAQANLVVVTRDRRGGIFSTIASLVYQLPVSLIPAEMKRKRALAVALWAPVSILCTRSLMALDSLDIEKKTTLGYTLVCRKASYVRKDAGDLKIRAMSVIEPPE